MWQKHTIKCRCCLQQFKNLKNPPQHEFIVFSSLDNENNVKEKFAQCNNCGIIHKVIAICTSEILNKEEAFTIRTIDDIKLSLPDKLVNTLEKHLADLSTYEAVEYIIQNELWGDRIILTKDDIDNIIQVKYLVILGNNLFKIDTFSSSKQI